MVMAKDSTCILNNLKNVFLQEQYIVYQVIYIGDKNFDCYMKCKGFHEIFAFNFYEKGICIRNCFHKF